MIDRARGDVNFETKEAKKRDFLLGKPLQIAPGIGDSLIDFFVPTLTLRYSSRLIHRKFGAAYCVHR